MSSKSGAVMFRQKLRALDYHNAENIDVANSEDLRALIVWLEDQKIRHYKIEERTDLRVNTGDNWTATFQKYLKDLECPYDHSVELSAALDWLLGVAVRYEFCDSCKQHPEMKCGLGPMLTQPSSAPDVKSALDIDPSDDTFKAGTRALAKIVQVHI